jgi:hypothetical protein
MKDASAAVKRKRTAMVPAELRKRIECLPARGAMKDALAGWLAEYNGPGYYGRTNWNHTAEFAYNHLQSASALLWLAKSVGVPRFALLKAEAACRRARPNTATQAAAVRSVLPWGLVEALLKARHK